MSFYVSTATFFFAPLWRMGPRCSSAETQVCHRSYIIAARVFRVKNLDLTPKNHIFYNFRDGARRVRPSWIRPWYTNKLAKFLCVKIIQEVVLYWVFMHTVYPISIIIVVVYVVWNNDEISAVTVKANHAKL